MTRYLYIIETQKPTGTSRFIKAFDSPFVVNDVEINNSNRHEVKLFNDRIESYSYLTTLEADIWPDLIEEFESLVKEWGISLEYTKNNYVYLIEKDGKFAGDPIYHRNPVLPKYDEKEIIPFYPEKKKDDSSQGDISSSDKDFFSAKYYRIFTDRVKNLLFLYQNCHSIPYIVLEAFVLTYGEFQALKINDDDYPKRAKQYQIVENKINWKDPNRMADFYEVSNMLIPSIESYQYYVKPSLCGQIGSLGNGCFFSLKSKYEICQLFWNFIIALDKWANKDE